MVKQKFWFRKRNDYGTSILLIGSILIFSIESPDEYVELTISEFINGKEGVYKGLLGWARDFYCNHCKCQEDYLSRLMDKFLNRVIDRAEGKAPTNAQWMRSFVLKHPAYKKDSIVSEVNICGSWT